jgi:hypothetical protein
MIEKILSKLFGVAEEINGDHRCPTYLYRWIVMEAKRFNAYIHHFVGDDWSLDLHDHPRRFISIGLWGRYTEQTSNGTREYVAPWIRTFPAEHQHRITTPSKSCWTFVIVLKPSVKQWGFWHNGVFIPWRDYVTGDKKHIADSRIACKE